MTGRVERGMIVDFRFRKIDLELDRAEFYCKCVNFSYCVVSRWLING